MERQGEGHQLLLEDSDVQKALEQAKAAFPHLRDWEYINEKNEEYFGFCLWGQFVTDNEHQDSAWPRRYFITFDTYQKNWRGHLTIGQHSYFWSSADVGDALLLSTGDCDTLNDAIAALKAGLLDLFKVFSVI